MKPSRWFLLAGPLVLVMGTLAEAGQFEDTMAAAATILTVAILAEAVAAAVTTVAVSEVATITAVAGAYFAAGGALNVGIGITLMALPVVGVIAAVIAVGAAAVIIANIPAPVTAANIHANAVTPPDGTPPAVTGLGFVGPTGILQNMQVVGGRGSDPGDDLDETVAAINAGLGLAPGDVPSDPGPCCPGTSLSLDLSPATVTPGPSDLPGIGESVPGLDSPGLDSPSSDACCPGEVGLMMVGGPFEDGSRSVPGPASLLLLVLGSLGLGGRWLVRRWAAC